MIEQQPGAQESHADLAGPVRSGLTERGAVLLRGFPIRSATDFSKTLAGLDLAAWDDDLFREKGRDVVSDKVFTTDNGATLRAHGGLHTENCYSPERPRWIAFYCQEAPSRGGETLLCDSVEVCAQLSGRLRRKFKTASRECDYIVGESDYQKAFGTTDPSEIRSRCARSGCSVYQTERGGAATTRVIFNHPYVVKVPETERESLLLNINVWSPYGPTQVWRHFRDRHSRADWLAVHADYLSSSLLWTCFKHAYAHLHIGGRRVRELSLTSAEQQELGSAIADQLIAFPWQDGDVLLIDNLQMFHCGLLWHGARTLRVMMGAFSDP